MPHLFILEKLFLIKLADNKDFINTSEDKYSSLGD